MVTIAQNLFQAHQARCGLVAIADDLGYEIPKDDPTRSHLM